MSPILDHDPLQSALRQLLVPLVRLVLARGIPHAAVDELLRITLAQEAWRLNSTPSTRGGVSRVSTATGLSRREVTRLLAADGPHAAAPRSLASEVLVHWMADPLYQRQGRPRRLPRTGEAPSFEALAQSVTRDVHPRSLLDELLRLEMAVHNTDIDTVELRQDAFVPRADFAHMLSLLGDNVGDHLQAAVDNVLGSGDAHFEQALFADELSPESVRKLRAVIAAQWSDMIARLAPALEQCIADDRAATGRRCDQRVRIGYYSYAAGMAAPGASQPQAPRDATSRQSAASAGADLGAAETRRP